MLSRVLYRVSAAQLILSVRWGGVRCGGVRVGKNRSHLRPAQPALALQRSALALGSGLSLTINYLFISEFLYLPHKSGINMLCNMLVINSL